MITKRKGFDCQINYPHKYYRNCLRKRVEKTYIIYRFQITTSGKKTSDGFVSELPVETLNTTVQREGSFIILRHDLGLEIVCDVEHYLCTFNIAKWYHGRMAGNTCLSRRAKC